jgi:hypothetical protein
MVFAYLWHFIFAAFRTAEGLPFWINGQLEAVVGY